MSESLVQLKHSLKTLKLASIAEVIEEQLMEAETNGFSYQQFLTKLLGYEIRKREEKQLAKRLKWADFPVHQSLDEFDISAQPALSRQQFQQLRELLWIEQVYNLILLGPPGVGKTHLAIGLGVEAVQQGYKVSFVTMDHLIQLLRTQEVTRSAQTKLKRITQSDLVIIDDLMFMAINRHEANLFFQLINKLYGQSSVIITSNKGPEDWGELLGDPAITTAILDRLLHKSEVIHLTGDSYRLKNRKTIFGND
ncbi:hypothetical protein GCM10010965_29630 [Caldalkalibacillus thermarum]|uniref:IS21-like element helper ATPase IstB n=1 Tax=Caldalkalibacillus thermarum TaxID=296745 RepID=UPI00166BBB28|nr:IS21-like element helper ATPase IstB [Caldalkalibacillus thermarum]GGK34764.1 hypothetical protein GCM10010965_29630 [Caldalkalibacillus thermarum]